MKIVSLPAVLLAAGLLLAGCGGGEWPSGAAPASTVSAAPSSSSPPPPSPAPAPAPSTGEGAGDSGGGGGRAVGRCTDGDLGVATGRTTGEAGQRHTTVVWTNTSSRACTMTGFGGVDLRGPADPMGPSYSLPRSSKQASPVRLEPGGSAHTLITWLPPQDGPGWQPTQLVVTPPDETTSTMLPWPGGAVLRQDGATRPGTYIDPVAAGAQA